VAAVTIGAVGVATLGNDDDSPGVAAPSAGPTTAAAQIMKPVGNEPISGWISLTQVGWGTRLDLDCSYAAESDDYSDPTWSTYTMYVHTADGNVEQVASWKAVPGKEMHLAAATASDADDITDVEVRTAAGGTVLELS
jgi:hypothetical protein